MTDRPIIMSAPMVLALLREVEALGTGKTMTRRLAWMPKRHVSFRDIGRRELEEFTAKGWRIEKRVDGRTHCDYPSPWQRVKAGDRLWVREHTMVATYKRKDRIEICYLADGAVNVVPLPERIKRPMIGDTLARGCYREASRLTLLVTATKIERLHEISEADAKAEGLRVLGAHSVWGVEPSAKLLPEPAGEAITAVKGFASLWESLHGSGAWNANPEAVAISFKPFLFNIDAMSREQANV